MSRVGQADIRDADGPPSRVPPGLAEDAELFDRPREFQPRLFLQLASRPVFKRFLDLQESPGDGPAPFKGGVFPPDQQDAELIVDHREDDEVDGDGGTWILVAKPAWHRCLACGTMKSIHDRTREF